jgi:hypothetical protein
MGILSNTVSICQFRVVGDIPVMDLFEWISERLTNNGFTPIDQGIEELSVGWVTPDDHRISDFSAPSAFWRDHYLFFTLRQDKRAIPGALLRAYLRVAEEEYLAANPGFRRVPKQKKEEMRESVRTSLMARTLPVPGRPLRRAVQKDLRGAAPCCRTPLFTGGTGCAGKPLGGPSGCEQGRFRGCPGPDPQQPVAGPGLPPLEHLSYPERVVRVPHLPARSRDRGRGLHGIRERPAGPLWRKR